MTKNCLIVASFCLFIPDFALAYLDPGTGTYVLQIIMAALLGCLVGVKLFWSKIKMLFAAVFGRKEKAGQGQEKRQG